MNAAVDGEPLSWLMALLAGLIIVVVGAILFGNKARYRRPIVDRLKAVEELQRLDLVDATYNIQEIEKEFEEGGKPSTGILSTLRTNLRSDLPPGALRVLVIGPVVAFAAVAMFFSRFHWLPDFSGPVFGMVAALFTYMYLYQYFVEKKQLAFLDKFPDAVDLIVRATRAGVPLGEAIGSVAKDAEEPIRSEFRRMADAMAVGIDFVQVLHLAALRIKLPDFQFFVVCLVIQRESGGQIAETLGALSTVLRKRKEMRQKVKALTAESRMSAKLIAILPVGSSAFTYFFNPKYLMMLLDDEQGQKLLAAAIVMVIMGLTITSLMTKFKHR